MKLSLKAAGTLAVVMAAAGCAKPTVGVDARADVKIDRPVPIEVAQPRPLEIAGPIRFDQPVNVTIEGLVIRYEGTFIPETLFGQINDNDSPEYVAAIFGKPDFESKLGDGTLIWRWKYRPEGQAGSLMSIFGSGKDKRAAARPRHGDCHLQRRQAHQEMARLITGISVQDVRSPARSIL